MHTHGSTSFEDRLREDFNSSPVGMRVALPDGRLGYVRGVQGVEGRKLYKVQPIDDKGGYLPYGLSCWYSADELRLHYYTASIDHSKLPSPVVES